MIWGAFRVGRYAMRASASRGPKQSPQPFGWVGKSVVLFIVVVLAVHWWEPVLIFGGSFTFVVVLAALCASGSKPEQRKPDPLAEAMKDYTGKAKS